MSVSLILERMLRGVRSLAEDLNDQEVLARLADLERQPPPILLDEQAALITELGRLREQLGQRMTPPNQGQGEPPDGAALDP